MKNKHIPSFSVTPDNSKVTEAEYESLVHDLALIQTLQRECKKVDRQYAAMVAKLLILKPAFGQKNLRTISTSALKDEALRFAELEAEGQPIDTDYAARVNLELRRESRTQPNATEMLLALGGNLPPASNSNLRYIHVERGRSAGK